MRLVALGLMAALSLLVAACASSHDVTGSFKLHDDQAVKTNTSCTGTGGYSDIKAGTEVVVKDEAGKILATSALVDAPSPVYGICEYTFTVAVPDAAFYSLAVGRRGDLTYSKDELAGRGWAVGFDLGG